METDESTKAQSAMLAGIRFCERCGGSIPEKDFHDGHALHVGNKNVHVDCLLKRSAWVERLALLLGVLAIAGIAWVFLQGTGGTAPAPAPAPRGASKEAVQALADAGKALGLAEAADRKAAALEGHLAELRTTLSQAAGDLKAVSGLASKVEGASGQTAALQGKLDALAGSVGELGALNGKFNSLAQALTDLRKDVATLKAAATASPPETPK